MIGRSRALAAAVACAAVVTSRRATAEPDPFTALGAAMKEVVINLHFWGALEAGSDTAWTAHGRPGGMGARASVFARGLGVTMLAGRVTRGDEAGPALGGRFGLRPLAMAESRLYEHVDPYVHAGFDVAHAGGFVAGGVGGGGVVLTPWLHPKESFGPAVFVEAERRFVGGSGFRETLFRGGAVIRGVF